MARSYLVGFAVITPEGDQDALKRIRQAVGQAVKMAASPQNVKPVVMPASAAGFLDTQAMVLVSGYQYSGAVGRGGEVDKNQKDTLAKMAQACLLAGRAESDHCLIAVAYCLADSHKDGYVAMTCGPRGQQEILPKAQILAMGNDKLPFIHKLLLGGLRQADPEILAETFPQARAHRLDQTLSVQVASNLPRPRF